APTCSAPRSSASTARSTKPRTAGAPGRSRRRQLTSACAGVAPTRNSASIAASGSRCPGLFPSDSIDSMSDGPVSYRLDDSIAFITMDDGKVNVLGPTMQQALNDAVVHDDGDDAGAV